MKHDLLTTMTALAGSIQIRSQSLLRPQINGISAFDSLSCSPLPVNPKQC